MSQSCPEDGGSITLSLIEGGSTLFAFNCPNLPPLSTNIEQSYNLVIERSTITNEIPGVIPEQSFIFTFGLLPGAFAILNISQTTVAAHIVTQVIDLGVPTVTSVNLTPDSRFLVISNRTGSDGNTNIYNIQNGIYTLIQTISKSGNNPQNGPVSVISNDGNYIFVGYPDIDLVDVYLLSDITLPNPWKFQTALTDSFSNFGYSLATNSDGSMIFVGSPGNSITYSKRSGTTWSGNLILPIPLGAFPQFGRSIATNNSGTILVVGDPSDGSQPLGNAWVYSLELLDPTPQKLNAPFSTPSQYFGYSVDISGDAETIAIGEPQVLGGNVYVFTKNGGPEYIFGQQLFGNPEVNNEFGLNVVISNDGSHIIVAATNRSTTGSDAVFYTKNSGFWFQQFQKNFALTLDPSLAISNNGDVSAFGGNSVVNILNQNVTVRNIFSISAGPLIKITYDVNDPTKLTLSFSSNGALITYNLRFVGRFVGLQASLIVSGGVNFNNNLMTEPSDICDEGFTLIPTVNASVLVPDNGYDIVYADFIVKDIKKYCPGISGCGICGGNPCKDKKCNCDKDRCCKDRCRKDSCNKDRKCNQCQEETCVPDSEVITSEIQRFLPFIRCTVRGIGKTLFERIDYLHDHGETGIQRGPLIGYAMAKFILWALITGCSDVTILLRQNNRKFFRELERSRFCNFILFFQQPILTDYQEYFRDCLSE